MKYLWIFFLFFITQTRVFAAENIKINQILPNPTNEDDEYIELINPNSDSIDLSGYVLDDEAGGGSKPYKIPSGTTISANATLKFAKAQTGIALNNTKQKDQAYADVVNLIDKTGNVIDSITYEATQTDQIISRIQPTSVPTVTAAPTITPTLEPSSTPRLPTKTPTPTTQPSTTPEVLSASFQISQSISPIPTKSIPQSAAISRSNTLGISLIGAGVGLISLALYLARYTR